MISKWIFQNIFPVEFYSTYIQWNLHNIFPDELHRRYFDTNFTEALDKKTREFLKYTGEPETLAGEITQLASQFLVPFKVVDKIIGNIGKLKHLKNLGLQKDF